MKENKKLISEIIEEVKRDMSDEEILSLLAKSKVSKNTNSEESTKYTLGQKAADKIAGFAGSWAFIFAFHASMFSCREEKQMQCVHVHKNVRWYFFRQVCVHVPCSFNEQGFNKA